MTPDDLKARTKKFAVDVIRFAKAIPKDHINDEMASQLADSATSTAAHYRAVCRAKSRADFINKLSGAVEEVDESALGSRFFARLRSVPAHSQCHCGRKPTNSPESSFGHAKQLVPRQGPPSARPRLARRVKAGEAMAENHQSAITILQRITNQRSINQQCDLSRSAGALAAWWLARTRRRFR
jgi:four helix bundle protein